MIQANELRIGNYVNIYLGVNDKDGCWYSNYEITGLDIAQIDEGDYICIEPIELTEEILLKCGFRNSEDDTLTNEHGFTLGRKMNINKTPYFMTRGTFIELKHLHQLQNLYFALTGKELEVK